jgi:hypothetical protein
MATRKKTKGKAKRQKTPVTKAATRRKTTTVRKTKAIRKKAAKKAPLGRASPKKARPTAKAAVKPTPDSPPAQPEAVKPTPSRPAPAVPRGERIGVVTHYYSHLSVATIRLESGTLRLGDMIHVRGHTTDFSQKVESIEVKHAPATEVGSNEEFGLKVVEHAREHDVVFKVRS